MKNKILIIVFFFTNIISLAQDKNEAVNLRDTRYSSEDGAIVGYNLGRYNNRPLYCNNTNAFILAGDMPYLRFVRQNLVYGSIMLAIKREGKGKWLQECNDITSKYIPGRMVWTIKDSSLMGISITYTVVPMSDTIGMAVHVNIDGALPGDTLIWAYGTKMQFGGVNLSWDFDVMAYPQLLNWGFIPDECKGNNLRIEKDIFFVKLPFNSLKIPKEFVTVVGKCSVNLIYLSLMLPGGLLFPGLKQVKEQECPLYVEQCY